MYPFKTRPTPSRRTLSTSIGESTIESKKSIMNPDITSNLNLFLTLIIAICFVYSSYVLKTKSDAQESIIKNMKTLLDAMDIERIKKINEWEKESFERIVKQRGDEFKKDIIPLTKGLVQPMLEEKVKDFKEVMEGRFDEIAQLVYDFLILNLNKADRKEIIEKHLPKNKDIFIERLIKEGEI